MKTKLLLSIIIVSFNTKDLLKQTLRSIYKSEKDHPFFEIIVIDNNSKDDSAEMVNTNFPEVKLIARKKNVGFGLANNLASQEANGKYLFFLNSDTIVKHGALKKMVVRFEKTPNLGVLGPKLLLESGKVQPFCIGYTSNLTQILENRLASIFYKLGFSKKLLVKLSLEYWNWRSPRKVDWVTGAALMIKKDIFKKIKGFDKKIFMYFEDQDLCLRVKKLGFETWVLPGVKIIHLGGKSLKLDKKRKKYYYQSQDYFFKKHFGKLQYWIMKIASLPLRILN